MDYNYNTNRKKLVLPEYGRNIHKMVDYATQIEDREKRNQAALAIINVMGNMNPHLRDIADFKHKLWDHLAIMSDFKLDIDSPYPTPPRETFQEKPRRVPYNHYSIRYKHYGKSLELMIKKAAEMPEGEEKEVLIKMLANHMKKSYLTWNRESVSDETIFKDMEIQSGGKLNIDPEQYKLSDTKELLSKNKRKKSNKRGH
jgi:hypothetical protein